jgi:Phage integrase family
MRPPTGRQWIAGNVRSRMVAVAASRASERLVSRRLPPLPHVTPHTLRRTYVSIMLLATNFDVPFLQSQVGHADSKMTMDVYAQLLDRDKRAHGAAFDALLKGQRARSRGRPRRRLAHRLVHRRDFQLPRRLSANLKVRHLQERTRVGAAGFEPATSRV